MANDPSPGAAPSIPPSDLQALQDGISANIQTILKAYDACNDPVQSATLIVQSQELAAQMSKIETALFHQETLEATATMSSAFDSANGFTAQLNGMAASLEKAADIIAVAAKVIGAVAEIVSHL
jgi:hypothetical protein